MVFMILLPYDKEWTARKRILVRRNRTGPTDVRGDNAEKSIVGTATGH
jgi:hypothetical protein